MPVTTPTWTHDLRNTIALAHALLDADWFDQPRHIIDFFEKPWKYDVEWQLWESCGKPLPDSGDRTWAWFLRKLEQRQ